MTVKAFRSQTGVFLVLAIGVVAMSSGATLAILAQDQEVHSVVIALYRMGFATAAVTIPAFYRQVWKDYVKLSKQEFAVLLISGSMLGLHFVAWFTSLSLTSVASSLVLVSTTPLWLGLASPMLLKEPTPALVWIGIFVAILGGAIIGITDWKQVDLTASLGNVLALMGAVFMAGYLLIGRSARNKIGFTAYIWVVYGAATLSLLVTAVIMGLNVVPLTMGALGSLIALGLIPQLIGHSAANYAVRFISATLVSIAILGEPIGSTLLAAVVLKEYPSPGHVAGGVIILAGIVIAIVSRGQS